MKKLNILLLCVGLLSVGGLQANVTSELQQAIRSQNVPNVFEALKYGADVNTKASNGHTALGVAVSKNNLPLAVECVKRGVDMNTVIFMTDKNQKRKSGTILEFAQVSGRPTIASFLQLASNYQELLRQAELSDMVNIMEINWVNYTPHNGHSLLARAVYAANVDAVNNLIKQGANVDVKSSVNGRNMSMLELATDMLTDSHYQKDHASVLRIIAALKQAGAK